MSFFVIRKLAIESGMDIIKTPLWWYRDGLPAIAHFWVYMIRRGNARLGVALWVRNIFKPMFGQHDLQGRFVSFFMRVTQIIGRGSALIVLVALITMILVLWIVLPFLLLVGLVLSIAG